MLYADKLLAKQKLCFAINAIKDKAIRENCIAYINTLLPPVPFPEMCLHNDAFGNLWLDANGVCMSCHKKVKLRDYTEEEIKRTSTRFYNMVHSLAAKSHNRELASEAQFLRLAMQETSFYKKKEK